MLNLCLLFQLYSNDKDFISFFPYSTADAISCYVCSSDKLEACSRDYQKNDVELPFEQCLNNVAAACYTKVEGKMLNTDEMLCTSIAK